jgi:hypothetical protein
MNSFFQGGLMATTRHVVVWTGLFMAALSTATAAQDAAGGKSTSSPPPQAPALSVEFPGGTVNEYIAALKAAAGATPVNAVISGDAGDRILPRISLRSVTVSTAISAIEAAAGSADGRWSIQPIGGGPGGAYAIAVDADRNNGGRGSQLFEVHSIQQLIQGEGAMPAEVVLSAVEASLERAPDGRPRAEIRFHKDSGLLLVRGRDRDVLGVRQVVQTLTNESGRKAKDTARARAQVAHRTADLRRAELRVQVQEAALQRASRQLDTVREMVAKGEHSASEVEIQQAIVEDEKAKLTEAQIDLDCERALMAAGVVETDSGELAVLRKMVEDLRAQVNALQERLGHGASESR